MKVELSHDAADPAGFPRDDLPEIAVVGRSNVGKSSFINALVGRRRLARTSGRPGKTRRIHFYRVDAGLYVVDLPGYGYAARSHAERRAWRGLVEAYLHAGRTCLRGAVLLVDIRRGPEAEEEELLHWLAAQRIPAVVALTKSDKLTRQHAARRRAELVSALALPEERLFVVSARTGVGLGGVAAWIRERTGSTLLRPDGRPLEPPSRARGESG